MFSSIESYRQITNKADKEFRNMIEELLSLHHKKEIKLDYENKEEFFKNVIEPAFVGSMGDKSGLLSKFKNKEVDYTWNIGILIELLDFDPLNDQKREGLFAINLKMVKSMLIELKSLRNYMEHEANKRGFYYERLIDNLVFIFTHITNNDGTRFVKQDTSFVRTLKIAQATIKLFNLSSNTELTEEYGLGTLFPEINSAKKPSKEEEDTSFDLPEEIEIASMELEEDVILENSSQSVDDSVEDLVLDKKSDFSSI